MALFTDSLDQTRQAESIQRKGLTGKKKLLMNMLGYNKHGEKTAWGKVMPFLTFGGDMGARIAANKIAKGSQAGETLKETNKEYWAAKGSQFKFALEAAKLGLSVAGGGALGANNPGGSVSTGTSGSGLSTATPPISGAEGISGGGGLDPSAITSGGGLDPSASGSGNDLTSVISGGSGVDPTSVISGGTGAEAGASGISTSGASPTAADVPDVGGDPVTKAMDSNVGQEIQEMQTDSDVKDTEDLLEEKIKKEKGEIQKQEKEQKEEAEKELTKEEKLNKNLDDAKKMANKAAPIVGAGIDWYQKARAVDKEEERFKKKQLSRKVMADYNLL